MSDKKEEQQPLTIHEKWQKDSELPNGGIGFDDSEWDGAYIPIRKPKKDKDK